MKVYSKLFLWMFHNPQVDPEPYYHACVQESCSCEFEGKFLGYCTAVAAYAEACSDQDVCINWRTPDLCRKLINICSGKTMSKLHIVFFS